MKQEKALENLNDELNTLISTPMGRRTFIAGLPILLSACATVAPHRQREGDNSGQATSLSFEDEKNLTQEVLPQMKKEYPAVNNSYVQHYINDLGQKIVLSNNLKNNPYNYSFTVVDVKNVNAFALPAGTVFVTAPLIKMASNEAELAGVIGHEIGHIKARHTAERMEVAKKEENKSLLYGLGGALLGGVTGFGLGKLLCKKQDRECLQRAALYGGLAGAGGGLLIQKFAFMANSREDEMEADRIGFRTSYNAGYHKDYIGSFYNKLYLMEQEYKKTQNKAMAPFADAMSTHPPGKERVAQMNELSSSSSLKGSTVSTPAFAKVQGLL